MAYSRWIVGALCIFLSCIPACSSNQTNKNIWKEVRSVYGTHLNTSVAFKPDEKDYCEPHEIALIQAMEEIDFQLEQLMRAMDDSDRGPDQEWAEALFKKFPWLSGLALADGQGRVFDRFPAGESGAWHLGALLTNKPEQNQTELRAQVEIGARGPEFWLAKPIYMQDTLRALIISRFSLYDLLRRAGAPEKFALAFEQGLLWPGGYVIEETPLQGVDWKALSTTGIEGRLSNARGEFYWLSTYLADLRLFYTLPVTGNFSGNPRVLELLKK